MVKVVFANGDEEYTEKDGIDALRWAAETSSGLVGITIYGLTIKHQGVFHQFNGVRFVECTFVDTGFGLCNFTGCTLERCNIANDELNESWIHSPGIGLIDCKFIRGDSKRVKEKLKTNEEIAHELKVKSVENIANKRYVKLTFECDFCHKEYQTIQHRNSVKSILQKVPNCNDKFVCNDCYNIYDLRTKEYGNRTYGYHGHLSFYKTPMDSTNTAILGLEMEFEGDFKAWKELQDAHKGALHYGYDSSVKGQNELSWDCGSYSWWKYLAPLKEVCAALRAGGGHAGDTAGIHIHVSRPDVRVGSITTKINEACHAGVWRTIMDSVSLRTNREKYDRYANLSIDCGEHHAGISYNGHDTCEFRIFASTTDYKLILKRLRFCKEVFNLFADNPDKPKTELFDLLEPNTVQFILQCGKIQLDKGFITRTAYQTMCNALQKEPK